MSVRQIGGTKAPPRRATAGFGCSWRRLWRTWRLAKPLHDRRTARRTPDVPTPRAWRAERRLFAEPVARPRLLRSAHHDPASESSADDSHVGNWTWGSCGDEVCRRRWAGLCAAQCGQTSADQIACSSHGVDTRGGPVVAGAIRCFAHSNPRVLDALAHSYDASNDVQRLSAKALNGLHQF